MMICPNCDYKFEDIDEAYEVRLIGGQRVDVYVCPDCGYGTEDKEDFYE